MHFTEILLYTSSPIIPYFHLNVSNFSTGSAWHVEKPGKVGEKGEK
jgi:hypothetical protein